MKIVAIITARDNSKRFPNKSMQEIEGKPIIQHIVGRLRLSQHIEEVAVATSTESPNIVKYCVENKIPCYQGSETDIIDRLYKTAKSRKADIIVRVWGDSPLIDVRFIDPFLQSFLAEMPDYASTKGLPWGNRFTIIRFKSLETIIEKMSATDRSIWNKYDEDMIWRLLKMKVMVSTSHTDFSHLNFEVNTPEDLDRIRAIFAGEGDI